jgi:hypothetical protein
MKLEPAADHRQIAQVVRQQHVAFVDIGFTDEQALELTSVWLDRMMEGSTR